MTDFTLDTSGTIHFATPYAKAHGLKTFYLWSDLSPFEQGYTREMLTANAPDLAVGWRSDGSLVDPAGFSDLAPATLAAIRKDCAALHAIMTPSPLPNTEHGGGVFWRERSEGWKHQHFRWSRRKLSDAFPPLTVLLNDAGKVVFA